ncbi:MAG: LCP family protein, partial [Thermomicrobiales bacterium]
PAQQAIRDQEVQAQQLSTTSDEGANEPDRPSRFTGLTPEDVDAPAQSDLSDPENPDESAQSTSNAPESPSTPVDPPGPSSSDAESDVAFAPPSTSVADSDGVNILLMGVDARDTDTIDIGVRPDSLAVLNLNEENGACRILAIPRDSRVNLPGYGASKVNHALAVGGIPYEILVVEDYLDIEIDHYALVDFSGLVQVVDALDGITVNNPEAFNMGETSFAAGEIDLDGEEALAYSRFRGGTEGDFGRISRQQQVIRGLMDEVYDVNLVRVVPNMFSILSDHFRTGFGPTDLIGLADDYRTSCTSTTIETRTIAGEVATAHDDLMQMDLSFVISEPAIVREDVDWLLGFNEE